MQLVICSLGVVGNMIAIPLLLGKSLRNSFNKLIGTLAIFDLIYLMTMLVESLRKLYTDYHFMLSHNLLSPLNSISLMCSIYMTVGVSIEQHMAVFHPLDYRSRQQESSDTSAHCWSSPSSLSTSAISGGECQWRRRVPMKETSVTWIWMLLI